MLMFRNNTYCRRFEFPFSAVYFPVDSGLVSDYSRWRHRVLILYTKKINMSPIIFHKAKSLKHKEGWHFIMSPLYIS